MAGSEKLLECINADGTQRVNEILAQAKVKAESIKEQSKKDALKEAAKIEKEADAKAAKMKKSALSGAELTVRNSVLLQKRKEIDKTIGAVVDYLVALEKNKYFEVIYNIAASMKGSKGIIMLNAKDLRRLPDDFFKRLKKAGVEAVVADEPVNICGGFILKCGEIELSADFEALAAEKRDELEDFINSQLFGK